MNADAVLELNPATVVHGRVPFTGRLGLLLLDESSHEVLALTTSQLLGDSSHLRAGPMIVANLSHNNRLTIEQPQARRTAESLLVPLVVSEQARLSPLQLVAANGRPVSRPIVPDTAASVLGQEVFLQTLGAEPRRAIVRSTNGRFKMPLIEGGAPLLIEKALQMESVDGDLFSADGDTGAVVTTLAGNPVGIILGGSGDISFAAPIAGAVRAMEQCLPLTSDIANRWNELREEQVSPAEPNLPPLPGPSTIPDRVWDEITEEIDPEKVDAFKKIALEECF